MDGFELNKVAASILLTGVIIMSVTILTDALYEPLLTSAKRGYSVTITNTQQDNSSKSVKDSIFDFNEQTIAQLIKNASSDSGSKLFKQKCSSCHTSNKDGANRVGPNLYNVVNRIKASHPNYNYSAAMIAQNGSWDERSLFLYLHKPIKYIPGTRMSFIGFSDAKNIADVIKFLKENANK
ncbi:cytochrome c family protein [Orientia chuto str. Dubai]|uniref:Cytochrome c homolog n=1 Tax=Orientia chuto str. Dubai TaxID=1359168 RepID=A0A0F3MPA6_9RICK|nr:cytochrome c family protein [Candidatus Orientia mediorientalis]KJV57506.1 cytochrome c family protein [Orientia chuto str. Dubai]